MSNFTQGIATDGPVILKNGEPMTPEEIIEELNRLQSVEDELVELLNGESM